MTRIGSHNSSMLSAVGIAGLVAGFLIGNTILGCVGTGQTVDDVVAWLAPQGYSVTRTIPASGTGTAYIPTSTATVTGGGGATAVGSLFGGPIGEVVGLGVSTLATIYLMFRGYQKSTLLGAVAQGIQLAGDPQTKQLVQAAARVVGLSPHLEGVLMGATDAAKEAADKLAQAGAPPPVQPAPAAST